MDKQKQVAEVIRRLGTEYHGSKTELQHSTPLKLLVATILSAQTTDAHVNRVTATLFKKYRSARDFADTPLEELQKDVSSINFYKTKAKNIQGAARIIVERFGGEVPQTMDELVTLPGVARKTANIVLFVAFGINEGIAVDTHVKRVAGRLGLTENDDPGKIERDLMAVTPKDEWGNLSYMLILLGRRVCQAKKPRHGECVLYDICPARDM